MKRKKTIFKNSKLIYFTITNLRTDYYKGKFHNKRIVNKVRINKDKFYKQIANLK